MPAPVSLDLDRTITASLSRRHYHRITFTRHRRRVTFTAQLTPYHRHRITDRDADGR